MNSAPYYAVGSRPEAGFSAGPSKTQRQKWVRLGLVLAAAAAAGLAVIVSTHYVQNVKLLVGLIGGLAFVLLTMRWPEFGLLSYVALLSGIINLGYLPLLHLGPLSLNIADILLGVLLALVFLRATARSGFTLIGSPLMLPLLLFMGAALLGAANAILIQGVGPNNVLRSLRVLVIWLAFVPTLELVRGEKSLRRLLNGLLLLTGVLVLGVLFPNRLHPLLPVEVTGAGTGTQVYSGFTRFYYSGDMLLYAMVPVTVASLAIRRQGTQAWRIAFLGLLLFWLIKTLFREYWLTLIVACLLLLAFFTVAERARLLRRLTLGLVAGAILLAVFAAEQPEQVARTAYVIADRATSLTRNPFKSEASLQWRVIETRYALQQISSYPILGIGLGNSYRPPLAVESDSGSYSDWTNKYIENGYLWIAVMLGLVGLLPFLWLCAAYLLRVVRLQREVRDEGLRAIYLGFAAAFLGMVACNLATPTFVIGTRLVFFPVAMAIGEVILRIERDKGPEAGASGAKVVHDPRGFLVQPQGR